MERYEKKNKRKRARRTVYRSVVLLAVITILLMLLIVFIAGDTMEGLLEHLLTRDEHIIAAYLESEGEWRGLLSIFLLSIVQVITIVFPGLALHIASGLIYVWWKAFLVSYTGFIAGHTLVFSVVRAIRNRVRQRYGTAPYDGAHGLVHPPAEGEEETPEKKEITEMEELPEGQNDSLAARAMELMRRMRGANPIIVVMLSCFTPGMPNGVIPHIAARTNLAFSDFAAAIALSSWLQILLSCVAGHLLLRGNYVFFVVSILAQLTVTALVAWKREWILRRFK